MSFRSAIAEEPGREGLEDLSAGLRAFRFQGAQTLSWLAAQSLACPESLFGVQRYGERSDAILVARVGSRDVILQGPADAQRLHDLESAPLPDLGVFQVPEESATFRLSDPRAEIVWRQTCAVPLSTCPPDVVVYTRVAGISCAVIPEDLSGRRSYRLWVDYSYAPDLWRSFAEI